MRRRRRLESSLRRSCIKWAKKRLWWHKKFKSPGQRSVPDDVFAKHGRIVWVEFKREGEVPTEDQELEHEEMRSARLTVIVIDTREKFIEYFDAINKELAWLD